MIARKEILTDRLIINELQAHDHLFILELVNSPGWLEFIGDRNIQTPDDAVDYIEKITGSPHIKYWTVRLKADDHPAGIITLIKRDYLEYYDIGFAFLPEYTGAGYSSEATRAVLETLPEEVLSDKIVAVTTEENSRSVRLLEKLKFTFESRVEADGKILLQYALNTDEIRIGKIIRSFFSLFDNTLQEPDFRSIHDICSASVSIIRASGEHADLYGLESFIEPRKKMLTDGTLQQFSEFETDEETRIRGNIAQRYSKYSKKGWLNGDYFEGSGHKFFHLRKDTDGWKIAHVIWEDEV
ncbi:MULTISPECIES: GNAT family N-acetyltransferase [Chryseobacterium]|uniref:RimJ/RimL family protein N-acetyltransferase n=1 Tax=Chryseobacterium camelliae TaxID=1265445 RepID=A0ABU0TI72_9FLAO|nr:MULTISPECIES: GNAT family N-acetyltransferase [Chryseobacterium]MDT3409381.1 RimJ/RimL family protein N-acetyltransferase [Pseudacidovorax intermedius]MDQ1096754.1 RimJ/RimL family protein N-acetyltransferase [Chryseobacterium camelliae]MDQ1100697.1 RimJ/RimL family protein N-acetyltransferase [Chryseobacterium sp. SORGH_AS_1048]MDR6088036.1 RimJ/RimL family protein N-acetyltransferase [Chryseobacterium sp. SORGH_AS_0909]MDR6132410.1 RimJ/RimL family protein N-acetyltransferase [Chryseobact